MIKEAQEAQVAVAEALKVLKDFYAKAAKGEVAEPEPEEAKKEALMQKKKQPPIFEDEYKGMQAESGGVIGMLEVIHSDFARLEAETTTEEAAAAKAHQKFLKEAEIARVQKGKDITHKTTE